LLTPDTFVRAAWPGLDKALAIVHAAPACGASFTQYTIEFEAGGRLAASIAQRFIYVLEGQIELQGSGSPQAFTSNQYAYLPASDPTIIHAPAASRVAVIEKPYQTLSGVEPPSLFTGSEPSLAPQPLLGDTSIEVRAMVPPGPVFDFAVNTMTYQPGAALPMVEVHVMEHGLLMLTGGGIYRLSDCWYPVTAGDFIWMGPYCSQWFGALGKAPAKYLIYKDWNRHPLA
jgi:(S)-ureidoglycine aminohydrolase